MNYWFSDGVQGLEWFLVLIWLICIIGIGFFIYIIIGSSLLMWKNSGWIGFVIFVILIVFSIIFSNDGPPFWER